MKQKKTEISITVTQQYFFLPEQVLRSLNKCAHIIVARCVLFVNNINSHDNDNTHMLPQLSSTVEHEITIVS